MEKCSFMESEFTDSSGCKKCKIREKSFCKIQEGSKISTQERYSTFKNTCQKAVFENDSDLNHYTCGKNGGICDLFRFKQCNAKEGTKCQ